MAQTAALDIAGRTTEIGTLPEVTMKIMQVVQDSRSTAHDLHKIVSNDPALSARILRVVNSAFYGLPGQIGSIDRAIMLLGLNAVKNIAIAASLSKLFKSSAIADDFSGKELWTHSVAVGAANKLLTKAMGLALPDEAFLAGLIHDLGLVAIIQCAQKEIPRIIELTKSGCNWRQAEEQVIGATHQEIGTALSMRWKFPRSFQYVTHYHHNPQDLAKENRLLAVVTHISDVFCAQNDLGVSIMVEKEEVSEELLTEVQLTQPRVDEVLSGIEDELEAIRAMID